MHIPTFTLLIVEDLSADRERYRLALSQDASCNYHLLEAASVSAGLKLCRTRSIDAIVLDYVLPDGDGLEFLAALNAQSNGGSPPVVMVTGMGDQRIAVRAMKLGAEDYLVKSDLTPELLQSTMRMAIEYGRLRLQLQQSQAQAELTLQAKNQQITTIWESMTDAYMTLDLDWRIVYANSAATEVVRQLVDLTPEEFLGKTHWEVFPWSVGNIVEQEYRRAVTDRVAVNFEIFYQPTETWFEVHAYPSDVGVGIYFQDIDKRKRDELARSQAEREIDRFFDLAIDLLGVANLDGYFMRINPACEQILGFTSAEIMAQPFIDFVHPEDIAATMAAFESLSAGNVVVNFENRYRCRDGSYRWILWSAILEPERNLVYASGRDVTERKHDEELLRQNEELTRRILESNRDCIKVVDLAGRLIYMNDYGQSLMEVDDFSTVARSQWLDFWQGSDRASAQTAFSIALAGGVGRFDGYCPTAKGTPKWWEVIVTPILTADGQVSQILSVSRDVTERQQAALLVQGQQATIQQQLGEIESIYRAAPIGLSYISNELKFVRINEQLAKINGLAVAEHIGLTIRDVLPELAEAIEPLYRQVIESGEPIFDLEVSGITAAQPGVERHWLAAYHPQTDVSGRVLGVNATVQEITERKRLEAQLRQRESQLQLFVKYVPAGVAMFDRDMRYIVASDVWLDCHDLCDRDIVGRSHYDLYPNLPQQWKEIHQRCLAGTIESCEEDLFPRPDGSLDWVRWEIRPWYTDTDEVGGIIMFSEVITERKRRSAALLQSERKFSAIFNQTFQLMGLVSVDGVLLEVNQAALDSIAALESEIIGKSFWEAPWWHTEQLQQQLRDAISTAASGQFVRYEVEFLNPSGGVIITDFSLKPMFDEVGQVESIVAEAHDITERKQAQADLEQRNQELDSFVYVVSHDLKAPLRGIASLSEWIEEDFEGSLSVVNQQQMTLLRSRVYKMEATIDGLLDYARSGSAVETVESVSIAELLADVIDQIAPPPTFRIELPPELPTLSTRRLPLFQVFANLIGNGIKHHHSETGSIVVSVENRGDCYQFSIADDGPGIAPEHHDRMFKIFQAVNPQNRSDSTGIGLAIVKKIVEAEGGTIWLESEPGKGTTFYFTWLQN